MQTINIEIAERRARVIGSPVLVCNNTGDQIAFTFDEEWADAGAKTARFVYNKDGKVFHQDVPFTDNTVEIPPLENTRDVRVGVFAGALTTTTAARIPCEPSILCGSGEEEGNLFEQGRQVEREELVPTMWKAITCGGVQRSYAKAFMGLNFDSSTFKPVDKMLISDATSMFESCSVGLAEEKQVDLAANESERLDTGPSTKVTKMFYNCGLFKSILYLDFSSIGSAMQARNVFSQSSVQRVEVFIPPAVPLSSTFLDATNLSYIGIEGELANSANFQSCPLTNESATNILQHLADCIGTEYEFTFTITFSDEVWANLDALGNASPNGNSWRDYCEDLGWTI